MGCFYEFSILGWLADKGPPSIIFINFQPLDDLAVWVHHRSLMLGWLVCMDPPWVTFVNYEDGCYVVIITNLRENVVRFELDGC